MAEVDKKSDFVTNPEELMKEAEKLQKDLVEKFHMKPESQNIKIKKDYTNKPVIEFNDMNVGELNVLLSGTDWKYGTYYMAGSPKEGFYKMNENQQYVFVPIEYKVSTLNNATIDNAYDMANAIKAYNPRLADHIYVSGNSLQITEKIDNLELPSPWKFDAINGCIVNGMTSYVFDIKMTNEANRDMSAYNSNVGYKPGSAVVNTSTRDALSARRENEDKQEEENHLSEQSEEFTINLEDLSPKEMYNTYQNYVLVKVGDKHELQNKANTGEYRSIDIRTQNSSVENVKPRKSAYLNNLWISACNEYSDQQSENNDWVFEGDNAKVLATLMAGVRSGEPVSSIMSKIEELDLSQTEISAKTAYRFLEHLRDKAGLNIQFDRTLEKCLDEMTNNPSLVREFLPNQNNNNNNHY